MPTDSQSIGLPDDPLQTMPPLHHIHQRLARQKLQAGKTVWIALFDGCFDRAAAEQLRYARVFMHRDDCPRLDSSSSTAAPSQNSPAPASVPREAAEPGEVLRVLHAIHTNSRQSQLGYRMPIMRSALQAGAQCVSMPCHHERMQLTRLSHSPVALPVQWVQPLSPAVNGSCCAQTAPVAWGTFRRRRCLWGVHGLASSHRQQQAERCLLVD